MLSRIPLPARHLLTDRAAGFAYPDTPRSMRLLNRVLGPVARQRWAIEPEAVKRRARARTGLTDFGVGASFDEPLAILCRSFTEEAQLNATGRLNVHHQLVGNLCNLLRLADLGARCPQAFQQPVRAPLFVVGMPRSGTTFLQRIIARDPFWRSAPFWEVMNPLPLGDVAAPPRDPDPRLKAGRRALRMVYWTSPELIDMHEMANEEPDEEIPILAASHCSSLYECMALLPEYVRWYTSADHTEGYRVFRRFLQAMQWSRPAGQRWLLKAPSHLEMLVPLHTVFDDATVVQTHRDPVVSVVSLSSMVSYGTRINFDHPNPHRIGEFAADFVERLLRAAVRDREPGDGRFVDVAFRQLVEDPIGQVRRVCAAAGRELDDAAELAMRGYAGRAARRSGRHRYAAEDFALDAAALRERFAFYYERFDVPREPV